MTFLTNAGWVVVHSLWLGVLLAGLTALALGLLKNAPPAARDRVAMVSLLLMAALPFVTMAWVHDPWSEPMRRPLVQTLDAMIALPTYLAWRNMMVPVLGACWLIGCAWAVVRVTIAIRRAVALRSSGATPAHATVAADVAQLSAALNLKTNVIVSESSLAHVPMVLGWRRPVILMPSHALTTLTRPQVRSILAHELAHVRRRDFALNLLQIAADVVLTLNPAARWVSRCVRIEREYCCDDIALHLSADRATYASALAALEDGRSDCSLAVAAVSGTLLDRIERIAERPRKTLTAARGLVAATIGIVIAASIATFVMALPTDLPRDVRMRSRRPATGMTIPAPTEQLRMPKRAR